MAKLTQAQKQSYIQSGGTHCPFCGSEDLQGADHIEADMDGASQPVECYTCGKTWTDLYVLIGVDEE